MKFPEIKTTAVLGAAAIITSAFISTGVSADEGALGTLFKKYQPQTEEEESKQQFNADNTEFNQQELLKSIFQRLYPEKYSSNEPVQPSSGAQANIDIAPNSGDTSSLEQLYNKYQQKQGSSANATNKGNQGSVNQEVYQIDSSGWPGVIIGPEQGKGESGFNYAWPYRDITFEMHVADQKKVSAMIFSLAVHAKDISADTPRDKFYRGVSGYHYSVDQICDWLNDPNKIALNSDERSFVRQLENHDVIKQVNGTYQPASKIKHVLAASFSKKRTFERNLRHERLHIYYDEDANFRQQCVDRFKALNETEQKKVLKDYSNYNQENLPQLIEEWAVGSIDEQPLPKV